MSPNARGRGFVPVLCWVCAAVLGQLAIAAEEPPSAAGSLQWGEARGGVQAAVQLDAAAIAGSPLKLRISIRSDGPVPVRTEGAFAWLLIVQGRDKALFSDKIALTPQQDWPRELAAGGTADVHLELADLNAYPHQKGLQVVGGYPTAPEGMDAPASAGPLTQALTPGRARLRCIVYLPRASERLMLASGSLDITVSAKPLAGGGDGAASVEVADLLERFRRDAFAGKAAHDLAVKRGSAVVPALVEAMATDPSLSEAGRMWLTTALIDIGDARATDLLVKLTSDPAEGTRCVVAYHGPKMKNAKVDEAILARAEAGRDPIFTAWAARGFIEMGRAFPERLIDAAYASQEPRARAEIAEVLARKVDEKNIARLGAMLKDDNELVRLAAVRAIGQHNVRAPKLTPALIGALDSTSDAMRQHACAALVKLTGQQWPYDPEAGAAAKEKTIEQWKGWWARQGKR